MGLELVVAVVVITLDCRLFQGAVHALDLAIGPGMVRLRQPVLDAVSAADLIEAVHTPACRGALAVLGQLGELDTVLGSTVWGRYGQAAMSASRKMQAVGRSACACS